MHAHTVRTHIHTYLDAYMLIDRQIYKQTDRQTFTHIHVYSIIHVRARAFELVRAQLNMHIKELFSNNVYVTLKSSKPLKRCGGHLLQYSL